MDVSAINYLNELQIPEQIKGDKPATNKQLWAIAALCGKDRNQRFDAFAWGVNADLTTDQAHWLIQELQHRERYG